MPPRRSRDGAASCIDCLAWGVLGARRCAACGVWRHNYPGEQHCSGCGRVLAVKDGHCRLCWQQARRESQLAGGLPRGAVTVLEAGTLRCHQLFFDRMKGRRAEGPARQYSRRGAPRKQPPVPAWCPAVRWLQPRLFETGKDFTRFDEDNDADLQNPWLTWAIYLARRRGEARGWKRGIGLGVRRALIIVLSGHAAGDTVCYSEIFPALRARGISAGRTAEVLQEMGVLADDRRPSFEGWLDRKLDGLADGIGREAGSWLRTMRDGGPRSRARSIETVWCHMNNVRPALLDWSQRYDHLREVTRDDIQAILGGLHGTRRSHFLVSLRSLFAFCKKKGMVFRNPASGIKVGQHPYGIAQPLSQDDVDHAAEAAATPSARLVLVLAAVHAARTGAIRAAQLDDVDLGNRKLIIAGRVRPIDEFTHQILLDWLGYRRTRWPDTANPHLLINQHSAMGTGPVSTIYYAKTKLRGQAATLERLRVDRQLEEARARGPDPLHLAAVFGLDPKTAIRYAENARLLLETAAEQQAARVPSAETARPAARTPHSLLGMDTSSGEDLVRAGYDALSHRYRGDDDSAEEYGPWLADLQTHLPDRGDVLDIGCGCGLPVARCLAAAGHRVTGVDISDVQIERARRLVPDATFIREDAARLRFSPGSFDAIICLYALIHMPLDQQPRLLRSIAEWLRPGGWLLATTGQDAWTGTQDNWLGGPATMWWSHADAATYRSWLQQAGLEVTVQQFVPEGDSGHALFWARRPPTHPPAPLNPRVRIIHRA